MKSYLAGTVIGYQLHEIFPISNVDMIFGVMGFDGGVTPHASKWSSSYVGADSGAWSRGGLGVSLVKPQLLLFLNDQMQLSICSLKLVNKSIVLHIY